MDSFGVRLSQGVRCLQPLGFRESLDLWKDAAVVMTDSGGLKEKTTALGIPRIPIRENRERPITLTRRTDILAGTQPESILAAYRFILEKSEKGQIPPKWDARAAERIWCIIRF